MQVTATPFLFTIPSTFSFPHGVFIYDIRSWRQSPKSRCKEGSSHDHDSDRDRGSGQKHVKILLTLHLAAPSFSNLVFIDVDGLRLEWPLVRSAVHHGRL